MLCPECGSTDSFELTVKFHIGIKDNGSLMTSIEGKAVTEEPDDEEVTCSKCSYQPQFKRQDDLIQFDFQQRPGDIAKRWGHG